jgi:outer membrane receptor for ferric coprogen and ferric-rhodotorulic acid
MSKVPKSFKRLHLLFAVGFLAMAFIIPPPASSNETIMATKKTGNGNELTTMLSTVTVTAERFPVNEKDAPRVVTVISSEQLQDIMPFAFLRMNTVKKPGISFTRHFFTNIWPFSISVT